MVPERYSFDHICFNVIPTLLSKASEVTFLTIREQAGQESANQPLLCNMPDCKLAV